MNLQINDDLLKLEEDPSSFYNVRTAKNVTESDITLAIAVNYGTPGEILTTKIAENQRKYIMVPYNRDVNKAAEIIMRFIQNHVRPIPDEIKINIAGNGIHTYSKYDVPQNEVNAYVYHLLKTLQMFMEIKSVRSGGQTGADHAGLVAAIALGVPAIGCYPKGFRRRNIQNEDYNTTAAEVRREIYEDVCEFDSDIGQQLLSQVFA